MASEQAGTMTTAEMMKVIEDLKKQNRALEEAKKNRADENERLTQAMTKLNRYLDEVRDIPKRMETLHTRIRELVHDCRNIKMDLEHVSTDMEETVRNKALCQSISSVVGIIGGTLVLTAGTGGVGLIGSFVGFAASATGFVTRMLHAIQAKEQTRRAEKSQMDAKYRADEFLEDYKILADIRDRFMTTDIFDCKELRFFERHAIEIRNVLNKIVEILRTLDVDNNKFVEQFDNMKDNYLLGVIAKRQKGVAEEEICKEILNTIRDHLSDYMPDEVRKVFVKGSEPVLGGLNNTQICVDSARTVLSVGGVALNVLASQSKNLSVMNITTDTATGVEHAGELTAGCGSTLTMAAKGVAAVTIILDISNLVSTYYTYKIEKVEGEKLAEQAKRLKERIDQLEEVNKSIDSFRKKLNEVLDCRHEE